MNKGSNPTPRAYLGSLYKNNKNEENILQRKTDLTYRLLLTSNQKVVEKKKLIFSKD
ncbi:MAG TPA: hypothetical protein VFP49_09795 [Nitrososphaeraceae archaeon]|nr:hypothetical protein [Nitrososphaeraceae archaeon]